MSWKGFQKAVARLPQMVMSKAGYSDETIDPEFTELEERFKAFEGEARKLHEDAKKFKDALSCLLAHQASFAATLQEVYQPIGKMGSRRTSTSEGGASETSLGRSNRSKPTESLRAAEDYARITLKARESLSRPRRIERRLVLPTSELMAMIERVKRFTLKRSHKLLDYDRHRDSVKKMREKPDRTGTDERTLGKYEANLDQASREYNAINNLLKQQIPVLLALKAPFMDPCFLTLYWYQLRVFRTLADGSRELMSNPFFRQKFLKHIDAQAALLADLRIPEDQGYYTASADNSQTGSYPPRYKQLANPALKHFGSIHQSTLTYSVPIQPFEPMGLHRQGAHRIVVATRKEFVVALYDYEAQAEGIYEVLGKSDDRMTGGGEVEWEDGVIPRTM
ncbi:hypothetical protein BC829DRAFT_391354 [Chytridium lagenaria]|nr:hypothetical protein BC829DRAFT_391354 [Chytridium lagenaria]